MSAAPKKRKPGLVVWVEPYYKGVYLRVSSDPDMLEDILVCAKWAEKAGVPKNLTTRRKFRVVFEPLEGK